jgi:hypothetical protein
MDERPLSCVSRSLMLAALTVIFACGDGGGEEDAADIPSDEIGDPVPDDVRPDEVVGDTPAEEGGDVPVEPNPEWEGVACGPATCDPPQICCFDYPYYYSNAECTDTGACGGYAMVCDGDEDCIAGGETCCVADNSYPASDCQMTTCDRKICHVDEECGDGQLCCPHPFIEDNYISYCLTVDGTGCPRY